ncbi:MAG: serine/threonine-protein kinase, partial [Gemmataceae bacterium]
MASPSLTELLKRWEQAFARGRDLSPEELCPGVPELQKALRAAIQQKRAQAMEQGPTIGFSPKNRAVGQQDEQTTTFHPGHDEAQPGEAEKLEQTVASGESTIGPGRRERSAQADKPKSTIPSPPGYTILGELGRGGMGVVYKARQEGLNRLCAIKMVLMGDHASPDELARFRTEAEAIARLQHPNIIQVFEIGTLGDKPFLSLEFCSAGSLEKLLDTRVLAPREAAQIVKILAEAIQVAHDANILHRDLKPANILLAETTEKTSSNRSTEISRFSQVEGATDASGTFVRMVPKITDFGLAKKMDEAGQTLSGVIVGTPSFMAPEQATGQKVGPLVDVYSLGAILYECLSGRPPFQAANSYETLMQVIHDDPIPPMRLNPKIPLDLDTITLKCLQKDTRKRYATAADLAADLDRWLHGQPIEARPVGVVERAGKWVRRHKLVSALSAL